ncbi:Sec-independent protein translocase protein TatB [Helicobacter kayseriensis]|uniref:Sec-independent protein translocase protein TatB n=1 Tax=Helicobacter kayseriensis TaxID=2905877 RepID=UPI001E4120C7|nr:Sec-independent protein translocase protein TatB [Helicobacter kayseriensis]MCE3047001.1 Sec-independent protein translocase protein TatB [Helicobacter kayseriensis]MCE3048339.1 Sec-independent protein translocase protein TatB [Helicobacter kayseriensis]
MFGMGFFEIFAIIVIAIIFLGPDKLPQAMIDLAKFFKAVKKTLDDAKSNLDKELHLEELKKEALEYKSSLTQGLETLNKDTFDSFHSILDEKPKPSQELQDALNAQSLENKAQEQSQHSNNLEIKPTDQIQEISYKSKDS